MSSFLRQGFLSLAVLASVVGVSPHTMAQTVFPGDTLFPGDSGANVFYLQQLLRGEGFSVNVDGIYGPQTEFAVRQFQQQCLLRVDGIAGPQTITNLTTRRCTGGFVPIQPPIGGIPIQPPIGGFTGPFVAVIPGDDPNDLQIARQVVPNAVPDRSSSRGTFINAGSYNSREQAEQVVNQLRDRRIRNARVEFRP